MRCELRKRAAARHIVPERCELRDLGAICYENTFAGRRAQHSGIKRDLTARIDGCGNGLRGDTEPIEAASAGRRQAGPHDRAQAAPCGRPNNGWRAATRTEGWAGEIDETDGITHNTSAHKAATAPPATNRRHHTETSSIVQLVIMPVFRTDTS